jgi:hypothetical protein
MASRRPTLLLALPLLLAGCPLRHARPAQSRTDAGVAATGSTAQDSGGVTDANAADGGMRRRDAGARAGGSHDAATAAATDAARRKPADDAGASGDAAQQSSAGDAGAGSCSPACAHGSVCVKTQVIGGALIEPDDAGVCPAPRVMVPEAPGICSLPPSFQCATVPAACRASLSCACAQPVCGSLSCESATAALVQCLLRAP